MDFWRRFKNNMNRQTAARLLMILLLLATVVPGFVPHLSAKIDSTPVSLSFPTNVYDFTVCSLQAKADYSLNQSRSASDFTYVRRIPANGALAVYHSYEVGNQLPRLLGPAPVLPNSLPKDIKFFYLSADIPPPFSNI